MREEAIEYRDVGMSGLKLADPDEGAAVETGGFSGYGAVFGNVDSHGDVIVKGAFRQTLRDARRSGTWPAMLLQHGGYFDAVALMPVGIWTEMKEDDRGLYVEGQLADTARGREAYALLKMAPRPALDGLSIGFLAREFVFGTKPAEPRRTIKEIDLIEVSLVTFPANPRARVAAVKAGFDPREMEEAFREGGLSQRDSKMAVAVLRNRFRRDAGDPGTDPREEVAAYLAARLGRLAETIHR